MLRTGLGARTPWHFFVLALDTVSAHCGPDHSSAETHRHVCDGARRPTDESKADPSTICWGSRARKHSGVLANSSSLRVTCVFAVEGLTAGESMSHRTLGAIRAPATGECEHDCSSCILAPCKLVRYELKVLTASAGPQDKRTLCGRSGATSEHGQVGSVTR